MESQQASDMPLAYRSWQDMSHDDIVAEKGHAVAAKAATGLPLLGLTAGNDGSWSARFWEKARHSRIHNRARSLYHLCRHAPDQYVIVEPQELEARAWPWHGVFLYLYPCWPCHAFARLLPLLDCFWPQHQRLRLPAQNIGRSGGMAAAVRGAAAGATGLSPER